ncbi:hypothetical protein GIB67_035051 [Kingdonia uniflora]|uniref:Anaphase-promoting complex subunit 2 n=1 Tax=Kingdonia uniflora TaxID=39325 RepID=A0A7J7L1P7_9MAGN|nr:hypothetical protein GIB67_035051 [Kingdonia uniflora]
MLKEISAEILHLYFKERLEDLSTIVAREYEDASGPQVKNDMDLDERINLASHRIQFSENHKLTKVHDLAGDDYRRPILESIKEWIHLPCNVYTNSSREKNKVSKIFRNLTCPDNNNAGNYRNCSNNRNRNNNNRGSGHRSVAVGLLGAAPGPLWQQSTNDGHLNPKFAHSLAIEDLRQSLQHTGRHSKLADSFTSALQYRLLTAGASTNDILHQYVSTIKALRIIDPTGVFLEAVGKPIREFLRGRKDTVKCVVTMLTDGPGGNPNGIGNTGDSLLEELNRDEENQDTAGYDDEFNSDEKEAWIKAECWEPDPVEADPLKGSRSRQKIDILGMIVGIIGSKDQLVNEYRVMLAEKLLNKSDYDIDSKIRTLELFMLHFGKSSMQKCEIMLNDLINSKRTNTNIKATITHSSQGAKQEFSCTDHVEKWQDESLNIPRDVEQMLSDYGKRYSEIKTPRMLLWKKNLGTVKLELQFEGRSVPFTVSPVLAAIIMQFQDCPSWTSTNLATAIGIPVDSLNRNMNFWISKAMRAVMEYFPEGECSPILLWKEIQIAGFTKFERRFPIPKEVGELGGSSTTILTEHPNAILIFSCQGIISESLGKESDSQIFALVDGMTSGNGVNSESCEDLLAADEEEAVASIEEQLLKEMTIYTHSFLDLAIASFVFIKSSLNYIMGMLTACGSLSLDRIHNSLKSRTGAFDLSDWVVNGLRDKSPELAEYVGSVKIGKSEYSGRCLFATKEIEAGTVKTRSLICTLASGECEEVLEVPDISLFRPETEGLTVTEKIEMAKILNILDVNSLTEDAISARVLGKNSDHMIVHTSRDVKTGEEITFAYFDVLSPLKKRRELSKEWGFPCNCQRCKFEEELSCSDDLREIEVAFEFGSDMGAMINKLEEGM